MMFEAQMCYFASFRLNFFAMGKHNAVHERMDHQYQRLFGVSQSCFHQISFWIWILQSPTFAGMSSSPLYSQGCWWSWGVGNPASNGRLCEQAHLQKDWGVSTRLYTCGWQPATRRILGEKGTMCCEGAALIAHC
jgi:hypothetical protein